ncbi:MAG: PDZ domain-containing protein [Proteobacteria bacterium]|nr:MAG: PDZ domain-containing protein [Pseudomonadota bacterium]
MNKVTFTFFLLFTFTAWSKQHDHLDINTQVEDGQAHVVITHIKDGKKNTIKESFNVDDDTDMDQIIADILDKNDIYMPPAPPLHHWVKQQENVAVEVIDNEAHITIKQDENGTVKVIKEMIQIDEDDDLNQMIDDLLKQHGIQSDGKGHREVIQIDRNYYKSHNPDQAYFGFMASVEDEGWRVISVIPESGAAKAGLQKDDVITKVNGKKTSKEGLKLKDLTKQTKVGDQANFEIMRDGKRKKLKITADKHSLSDVLLPPLPPIPATPSHADSYKIITHLGDDFMSPHVMLRHNKLQDWLGKNHQLIAVNSGLKTYFGTDQGVLIVHVDKDNKLALAEGDVILSINGEAVTTPKQVVKALLSLDLTDGFNLEVMRKKEKISIAS